MWRRQDTSWVYRHLIIGIAFLGPACVGGTDPTLAADATQYKEQTPAGSELPSSSTTRAADWTLTGLAFGEVRRPVVFQVTLADAVHPPVRVRFTGSASKGGGVFTPSSIDLSDTVRSGRMTYTPDRGGKRPVAMTNDGGLRGPMPMLVFVAKVQLGASGTAPSGNRCPDLGGFSFFTRGTWWHEIGRSVLDDRVAPDSAELIGRMGKITLRPDWSTSKDKGGNGIYGLPFSVVPGDQPKRRLVLGNYAKESDPGPVPFFPAMSIENWYDAAGRPPAPKEAGEGRSSRSGHAPG